MTAPTQDYNRSAFPDSRVKGVSDEKVQGVLENIFGIKIPETPQFESEDEQHFAGVLENVFGVRLPTEMVARAYTIFIKEYKS